MKKQQHARVKELDALGLENLHENQLKEILQILKLQQSLKPEGMVFRDRVIAQLGKIRQMN